MTKIPTMDDVMHKRKTTTLFIQFNPEGFDDALKQRHFDWFKMHQLEYESASFRFCPDTGHLCYAVYFDDLDDPRIKLYSLEFEQEDGTSSEPLQYQMVSVDYKQWDQMGGNNFVTLEAE